MDITLRQNQKKLNERMKMLRNRRVITGDGNVLRVLFMFILIGIIPIRCLMGTHIRPFSTLTIHFTGTGIITDTARRIIVTMAAIIRTRTSIGGIIAEVGMPRFHGGRIKKAICDSKIDVLAARAA